MEIRRMSIKDIMILVLMFLGWAIVSTLDYQVIGLRG
jgi:hypothetical protein